MRVIASDPFADDATHELDDLLAEADVVSMHAAVTPDTARADVGRAVRPDAGGLGVRELGPGRPPRPRRPHRGAAVRPPRGGGPRPLRGRVHRHRPPAGGDGQRGPHAPHRRRDLRHRDQPHHPDRRRAWPRCCAASAPPTSPTRRSSPMADTITSPTTTPEAVLAAAKKMLADGLVEGTSGNISGRLADGLVCLSPSSVPYDTMTLDDLVVVDLDGTVVRGRALPHHGEGPPPRGAAALPRARRGDPHPCRVRHDVRAGPRAHPGGDRGGRRLRRRRRAVLRVQGHRQPGAGRGGRRPPRRPRRRAARQPRPGHLRLVAREGAAQRRAGGAHREDRVGHPGDGRHDPPAPRQGEHATWPASTASCGRTREEDRRTARRSRWSPRAARGSPTRSSRRPARPARRAATTAAARPPTAARRAPAPPTTAAVVGSTDGADRQRDHDRRRHDRRWHGWDDHRWQRRRRPAGPNQASDVGVTATTITIGNITAENGVLGDAFAPAVRGLRAWVQATNAKGGINGRQIILKTCDDREDRARPSSALDGSSSRTRCSPSCPPTPGRWAARPST